MDGPYLVDGRGYTVQHFLTGRTYRLGYFQRDYVWETSQIEQLVTDLATRFFEEWSPRHERRDVGQYETYFIGTVITYQSDGTYYLTDGQQRVMTLLILLMHIRHLLLGLGDVLSAGNVDRLIANNSFGSLDFTLNVPEYHDCLHAFYHGAPFDAADYPRNVQAVWRACVEIRELFPATLRDEALPYFSDWLLSRVSLVEIVAGGQRRAWDVFQTMNARGKHLSSMDLLRGRLLEDAPDQDRDRLRGVWQSMMTKLGGREDEISLEFLRSVMRSKFARIDADGEAIRPDDLSAIQLAPHEWLLENWPLITSQRVGNPSRSLILDVLNPLATLYAKLNKAILRPVSGLESVCFNSRNGLTRQFDLALAAAQPGDSRQTLLEKSKLVANFVDAFYVSRMASNRLAQQVQLDEIVNRLLHRVRTSSLEELRSLLSEEFASLDDLASIEVLRLREDNSQFIRYLLARLTAWLEVGCEKVDPIFHYLALNQRGPTHQIEHVWSNSFSDPDGYTDPAEFQRWRNRIGGLLLLQGGENAGMRDASVETKIVWYRAHNMLAASMHPSTYGRGNAKFNGFIRRQRLSDLFEPYVSGFRSVIVGRSILYTAMARRVWHADALGFLQMRAGRPAPPRVRRHYDVGLGTLIRAGMMPGNCRLTGTNAGQTYSAIALADGRIETPSGSRFDSPSAAAREVLDRGSVNGWKFWQIARDDGSTVRIDRLRDLYLARNP